MQMLKTMVYLPPQLKNRIENLAKQQKTTQADIIRGALEEGLGTARFQNNASAQALLKIAEIGRMNPLTGPHDAEKMNEYLWGKDWSKDE